MQTNFDKMTDWETEKALYLMKTAKNLGMKLDRYGECAVNPSSGHTYLWLEDYLVALYMPISCELRTSDVWVLWIDPEDGEEHERTLDEFENIEAIYQWVEELEEEEE